MGGSRERHLVPCGPVLRSNHRTGHAGAYSLENRDWLAMGSKIASRHYRSPGTFKYHERLYGHRNVCFKKGT